MKKLNLQFFALPQLDPLEKTSIELRRSIQRLELHVAKNPNDLQAVKTLELLKEARRSIPAEMRDTDLVKE